MTLFERLRAWLGGVFGDGTADEADDPEAASDGPEPRVVHRDDRPLETPTTMDRTEPPTSNSESGTRVEGADAETETARTAPGEDDPATEPETVSIPDAEATAGDSAVSTPDDPVPDDPAVSTPDDSTADTADGDRDDSSDAFSCSVCGTTVDDPSEPCPLFRSTDVVPVADAAEADEPLVRGGRTAVSTADDDEAVDRLRDVRDDG